MRYLVAILLLFTSLGLFAQTPDIKELDKAMAAFDKALINKDSLVLNKLLNGGLTYGHSNGWLQTKEQVIGDLFNGKLSYKDIKTENDLMGVDGDLAAVRTNTKVDVVLDGKPMSLNLKVLQVWIWKDKHWELFARQSVKI